MRTDEVGRPREAVPFERLFFMEPRVSAEDFVGAFAAHGDNVLALDQTAEIQQRGIHVRHAGQILCVHRVVKAVGLTDVVADQHMMVRAAELRHLSGSTAGRRPAGMRSGGNKRSFPAKSNE